MEEDTERLSYEQIIRYRLNEAATSILLAPFLYWFEFDVEQNQNVINFDWDYREEISTSSGVDRRNSAYMQPVFFYKKYIQKRYT
jgi:hypothetical protein